MHSNYELINWTLTTYLMVNSILGELIYVIRDNKITLT